MAINILTLISLHICENICFFQLVLRVKLLGLRIQILHGETISKKDALIYISKQSGNILTTRVWDYRDLFLRPIVTLGIGNIFNLIGKNVPLLGILSGLLVLCNYSYVNYLLVSSVNF